MVSIWDSWECDLGILDIEQEPEGDIAWEVLELAGSLDARILLDRIASRYLGFVEERTDTRYRWPLGEANHSSIDRVFLREDFWM